MKIIEIKITDNLLDTSKWRIVAKCKSLIFTFQQILFLYALSPLKFLRNVISSEIAEISQMIIFQWNFILAKIR